MNFYGFGTAARITVAAILTRPDCDGRLRILRLDPSGLDPEIPSGGGGEGGGGGGIPGWLGGLIQFWTDVFTGPNNSPRTFNQLQATHRLGMSIQSAGVPSGTIIDSQVKLVQEDEEDRAEEQLEVSNARLAILGGTRPLIPSSGILIPTENGNVILYPWQYAGPSRTGKGSMFENGNVRMRVMAPDSQNPNGYITYENLSNQKINPGTGRTISRRGPGSHVQILPGPWGY